MRTLGRTPRISFLKINTGFGNNPGMKLGLELGANSDVLVRGSLVPRLLLPPLLDCVQYANTESLSNRGIYAI